MRSALFNQLGEGAYKGIYSLVALVGLGLLIYGGSQAEFVPVWDPPVWTRHIAWVTMIPALILIVGANVPGNIKRFTPHPMMWSVLIWALTHLAANGDQASVIMFAPFAAFAVIHILTANARGATVQTEVLPFAADMKVIAIGVVSYIIIGVAHSYLFGMPAF